MFIFWSLQFSKPLCRKWLTKRRERRKSAFPNKEIKSAVHTQHRECVLPKACDVPFARWIYICRAHECLIGFCFSIAMRGFIMKPTPTTLQVLLHSWTNPREIEAKQSHSQSRNWRKIAFKNVFLQTFSPWVLCAFVFPPVLMMPFMLNNKKTRKNL